ncbi:MAG: hypothetical protein WDN66_03655 [Candidatus Saccharibacteria bacterium]
MVGTFAVRHFTKRFEKDYKGKRWGVTFSSIEQDLKRIYSLQTTQQVDELKHGSGCVLFKYDFTVAQSGVSPKASGNRCIVFLDIEKHLQTILLIYGKTDLPKKQKETNWIFDTIRDNYRQLWDRLD